MITIKLFKNDYIIKKNKSIFSLLYTLLRNQMKHSLKFTKIIIYSVNIFQQKYFANIFKKSCIFK